MNYSRLTHIARVAHSYMPILGVRGGLALATEEPGSARLRGQRTRWDGGFIQ